MMTALAALAIGYALVCVLAYVFQSRLVFFPDRSLVTTPMDAGLSFEDVSVVADDGVRLHAWWVPSTASRYTVLFAHGNAGNMSHRLDSIRIFHDLGLSVLIFDYRGYGNSEGRISEAGTYRDATAAYRHLVEVLGHRPQDVIFFGRSLGGAVAIELASRYEPAAVIAESCFPSLVDVGARAYPWLPVRWLTRIRYPAGETISRLTCPKLIIHSPDDHIVPFDLGRRLFESATEPKTFLEIRGDHNSGFLSSGETYRQGIQAFVSSLD